jgi:signal transduction histidine kinase
MVFSTGINRMPTTLAKIYTSSLRLLEPTAPEKVYQTIVDESLKITNGMYGTLYLSHGKKLIRAYSTLPEHLWIEPRENGYTYEAFRAAKPIIASRKEIVGFHPNIAKSIRSIIFIPLFYSKQTTGVLNIQSEQRVATFSKSAIHMLQLFGAMISMALRKTQAQHETEKVLENRDLFISMASHELKTPLTVIKLYAELLEERFKNDQGPEYLWIGKLTKETDRLINLVNELLHVDQAEQGELIFEIERCHLRSLIQNAITNSQINYPNHVFQFEDKLGGKPDAVLGDCNKLTQVVINLLNNGAKFSPNNSVILVELKRRNSHLSFSVIDQGIGIADKDIPHIFDTFYKSKRNEIKEGIGIGLSLVKQIVEQSNGEIHIESKLNQGTTFTIEFPMEQSYARKR